MKDEIDEEIEKQRREVVAEDIKNLMKNMKMTATQAMQALEISEKDQARYMAML